MLSKDQETIQEIWFLVDLLNWLDVGEEYSKEFANF